MAVPIKSAISCWCIEFRSSTTFTTSLHLFRQISPSFFKLLQAYQIAALRVLYWFSYQLLAKHEHKYLPFYSYFLLIAFFVKPCCSQSVTKLKVLWVHFGWIHCTAVEQAVGTYLSLFTAAAAPADVVLPCSIGNSHGKQSCARVLVPAAATATNPDHLAMFQLAVALTRSSGQLPVRAAALAAAAALHSSIFTWLLHCCWCRGPFAQRFMQIEEHSLWMFVRLSLSLFFTIILPMSWSARTDRLTHTHSLGGLVLCQCWYIASITITTTTNNINITSIIRSSTLASPPLLIYH